MQSSRDLQCIIDQIRNRQTTLALEAIEKLDNTVLDTPILLEDGRKNDSILKAGIECDALDIIVKLIEKKCSPTRVNDALTIWFEKVYNIPEDISSATKSMGITLLHALFTEEDILNQEEMFGYLMRYWNYSQTKNLLLILNNLLEREDFERLLFNYILTKATAPIESIEIFEECLKIILQHKIKLTNNQKFILELAVLKASPEQFKRVLQCYRERLQMPTTPQETKPYLVSKNIDLLKRFESIMTDFPEKECWRLFIDGKKQTDKSEHGWVGYERREPGCIQKMYDAFIETRENHNLQSDLTYTITDRMHQTITTHFKENELKGFRVSTTKSGHHAFDTLSYAGFLEITQKPYSDWFKIRHRGGEHPATVVVASFVDLDEKSIITTVEKIIQNYHINFNASGDNRIEQLQSIIKLASDYARFHPYCDGNNRTAVCILNRELQKHGFPLTVLSDPNELEGHSQAELFTKVCEGMQHFLTIKAGNPYPGSKTTDEFRVENKGTPPIKLVEPVVEQLQRRL